MGTEASLILFNVLAAVTGGLIGGMLGYRAGKTSKAQDTQLPPGPSPSIAHQLDIIRQNTEAAGELLRLGGPSADTIRELLDALKAPLVEIAQNLRVADLPEQQYFRAPLAHLSPEDQISVYAQFRTLYRTTSNILLYGYTVSQDDARVVRAYSTVTQQLLLRVLALGETTLLEEFSGRREHRDAALQKFRDILGTLISLKDASQEQRGNFDAQVHAIISSGTFTHQGTQLQVDRSGLNSDQAFYLIQTAMRQAGIL